MKTSLLQGDGLHVDIKTVPASPSHTTYTTPVISDLRTRFRTDRWRVYSPKLRRTVTFYGTVAYLHWMLIEVDPDVETFCEQPLKITMRLPVGEVTTFFDMWIRWKSGREEFRAVRSSLPENESNAGRQIEAQRYWCSLRQIDHTVITAEKIKSNSIYISNCKFVLRYAANIQRQDTVSVEKDIVDALRSGAARCIKNLQEIFVGTEAQTITGSVCRLILAGQIDASIRTKLISAKSSLEVTI